MTGHMRQAALGLRLRRVAVTASSIKASMSAASRSLNGARASARVWSITREQTAVAIHM